MITYISILRGINVSGQKMIKMDVLREMYSGLQFINVRTYIQSGNVVFQFKNSENGDLEKLISGQIIKSFGLEVPVIVIKMDELKIIVGSNPFIGDKTKDTSFLHVTFLSSVPERDNFETIGKVKLPGEELVLINRAVYLYCPNGYGNTKLSNTYLEKSLKTSATTRNWKTTIELLTLAESKNIDPES